MTSILLLLLAPSDASACDIGQVVINEFMANPDGTDTGNEWLELYNAGSTAISLEDWTLERAKSDWGTVTTFSASDTLPPGAHFVVAGESVSGADLNIEKLDLGNGSSNGDAVRLTDCEGGTVDVVVYGPDNSDGFTDEAGALVTSTAPGASSGKSLARISDGYDTDLSGDDFCTASTTTLGAANEEDCGSSTGSDSGGGDDTGPVGSCDSTTAIKINEFNPNPEGGDTDNEWVELYNAGSDQVSLDGWTLQSAKGSWSGGASLDGAVIASGEFLLVGESNVSGADLVVGLDMGNAGSNGDGVRLLDCDDQAMDSVLYGPDNSDGLVDDSGAEGSSLVSAPAEGFSVSRIYDGADSDLSGEDFWLTEEMTPGAPNPVPPDCNVDNRDGIKVNEIFPNPDGSDAGMEWVELHNQGDAEQSIEGWSIEAGKSSWGLQYSFPTGSTIPAGGFVVVSGVDADVSADFTTEAIDLGNASSNDDGVRVVDCEGDVVDTVLYGPDDFSPELEDDAGSAGTLAPSAGDDQAVGRVEDGVDSDDHAADWEIQSATPGSSNASTGSDTGGGGGDRPGCGNRPSSSDKPDGRGCAVPAPFGGLELVLAGFLLIRRRR